MTSLFSQLILGTTPLASAFWGWDSNCNSKNDVPPSWPCVTSGIELWSSCFSHCAISPALPLLSQDSHYFHNLYPVYPEPFMFYFSKDWILIFCCLEPLRMSWWHGMRGVMRIDLLPVQTLNWPLHWSPTLASWGFQWPCDHLLLCLSLSELNVSSYRPLS